VLIAFFLTAAAGAVVSVSLAIFLRARVDEQLREISRLLVTHPGRAAQAAPALPLGGAVVVRTADGRVSTHASGVSPAVRGRFTAYVLHARADARPRTIMVDHRRYRVRVSAAAHGARVAAVYPVEGTRRLYRRFVITEAIACLATAGLIGAGTYGWLRYGLTPLSRIADRARRIAFADTTASDAPAPTVTGDRGGEPRAEVRPRLPEAPRTREIADLTAALTTMLDRLSGAYAARTDAEARLRTFVADASHELRTPLASILGYVDLCRTADLDGADHELATRRIREEALRMGRLVDDLLLLARLDHERTVRGAPVDLARLIADMAHDFRARAPEHRLTVRLPGGPVMVSGDDVRLRQALTNVLGNAHRHTPAGTHVTVTLTADAGTARVTIADDGPGIPEDALPRVFERFYRPGDAPARGSGLGLAIVQAIVTAYGGHVAATSVPGEGTTIELVVPLAGTSW
jgi:two-component system OmpR family sensor kinase